jgi:sugar (pentulose or hexulose) kinase
VVSGVVSREYRCDLAFRTLYGAAPGTFLLESDLQGGTFTVSWLVERWLRRGGGAEARSFDAVLEELEADARSIGPGADGLVLVPYWNGVMDPYWDDGASGIVIGWTGSHGPAHLYRAILEGIAFEQRLRVAGLERSASPVHELVVLGGGSKSDLWCQILADVLDRPVVRASSTEATALGVALLGAVAVGLHDDLDSAVRAMTSTGARFDAGPAREHYQRLYRDVVQGLYPALREPLQRLAELRRAARAAREPGR